MSETTPQTEGTHPLLAIWQQHIYAEFITKDVEAALATMTEDAHVLLIPVGTGGRGKDAVRTFYSTSFIPHIPPDLVATPISQVIGSDYLVEEAVHTFTHNLPMEWMIPGVPLQRPGVERSPLYLLGDSRRQIRRRCDRVKRGSFRRQLAQLGDRHLNCRQLAARRPLGVKEGPYYLIVRDVQPPLRG